LYIDLLMLYFFLVLGFLLSRLGWFTERHLGWLNKIIVTLFIPALTIHHLPKTVIEVETIWLSATPFIIFLSALVYVKLISSTLVNDMPRTTQGALVMTSGIGTVSFVGFPVIELLYGEVGLSYAIVASVSGTFLVLNTLGIFTALKFSSERVNASYFFVEAIKFPPFLAFVFSIIYFGLGGTLPSVLNSGLAAISLAFPPIALITLGTQLRFNDENLDLGVLCLGVLFKLIFAPLLVYVLFFHILGITSLIAKVCVLLAGVGAMHASSVMAIDLGLDQKISRLMPSITVPLSIPLLVFWSTLL